jgi:hypothetical protein
MEAKQAALRRKAHLTTLGDRGFLSLSLFPNAHKQLKEKGTFQSTLYSTDRST